MFERNADDEATQQHGVAGLHAQPGGIARDVRTVLVDESPRTPSGTRVAHDLQPVRSASSRRAPRRPDRQGPPRSRSPLAMPSEPGVGQAQAVEAGRRPSRPPPRPADRPSFAERISAARASRKLGPRSGALRFLGRSRRPPPAGGSQPWARRAELDDGSHPSRLSLDRSVKSRAFPVHRRVRPRPRSRAGSNGAFAPGCSRAGGSGQDDEDRPRCTTSGGLSRSGSSVLRFPATERSWDAPRSG